MLARAPGHQPQQYHRLELAVPCATDQLVDDQVGKHRFPSSQHPTEELLVPLFALTIPQLPADAVTCIEVGYIAL
jgi:hypothetical protein